MGSVGGNKKKKNPHTCAIVTTYFTIEARVRFYVPEDQYMRMVWVGRCQPSLAMAERDYRRGVVILAVVGYRP